MENMEKTEKELPECPVCMLIGWMFIPVRLILKVFSKLQNKISCRYK